MANVSYFRFGYEDKIKHMIIETEMSKVKAHSPIYCLNDWENGVITLDRIYLTSIYKFNNFQMSFHKDDDVMWKQTNTTSKMSWYNHMRHITMETYDNTGKGWYLRFDYDNEMSYKCILSII